MGAVRPSRQPRRPGALNVARILPSVVRASRVSVRSRASKNPEKTRNFNEGRFPVTWVPQTADTTYYLLLGATARPGPHPFSSRTMVLPTFPQPVIGLEARLDSDRSGRPVFARRVPRPCRGRLGSQCDRPHFPRFPSTSGSPARGYEAAGDVSKLARHAALFFTGGSPGRFKGSVLVICCRTKDGQNESKSHSISAGFDLPGSWLRTAFLKDKPPSGGVPARISRDTVRLYAFPSLPVCAAGPRRVHQSPPSSPPPPRGFAGPPRLKLGVGLAVGRARW